MLYVNESSSTSVLPTDKWGGISVKRVVLPARFGCEDYAPKVLIGTACCAYNEEPHSFSKSSNAHWFAQTPEEDFQSQILLPKSIKFSKQRNLELYLAVFVAICAVVALLI